MKVGDIIRCKHNVDDKQKNKIYTILHIDKNINEWGDYTTAELIENTYLKSERIRIEIFENCNQSYIDDFVFTDYLDRYELDLKYSRLKKIKQLLYD